MIERFSKFIILFLAVIFIFTPYNLENFSDQAWNKGDLESNDNEKPRTLWRGFTGFTSSFSFAKEEKIEIHFFWSEGCPHCAKALPFLENLEEKYPEVELKKYEISSNPENQKLYADFCSKKNVEAGYVPMIFVEDKCFSGYLSDDTTGKEIEDYVRSLLGQDVQQKNTIPEEIKLPIFGNVKIKDLSLPVLTVVIGALDGFNPCAMWVLIFLITLLLGMKNRKKMWILGTAFIMSSAIVYFFFMSAWLNLLLFLGFIIWVRIIIGLVALVSGGYNLREYFVNKEGTCKVTGSEKRRKVFDKLKEITQKKQFLLALGGIIILAFAVNLVELICSAGLPVVYNQILTLTSMAKWQYYLYLILYIFIFMLDDLIIFFLAMITLKTVGLTGKYSRYSHLIGGIIMLIIGILLIFKPEILMFG